MGLPLRAGDEIAF